MRGRTAGPRLREKMREKMRQKMRARNKFEVNGVFWV